jgi:hypothetical protein
MESRAKLFGHPIHQMPIVFPLGLLAGGFGLFTGWLGGELVDRLSVGVDDGAHVDALSSLQTRRVRA